MPYVRLRTNLAITTVQEQRLKTKLGGMISTLPGKSEDWLMVEFEPETRLWFRGSNAPAAFIEVQAFGNINSGPSAILTAQLCALLQEELQVEPARVYVRYSGTLNWGWNGTNF